VYYDTCQSSEPKEIGRAPRHIAEESLAEGTTPGHAKPQRQILTDEVNEILTNGGLFLQFQVRIEKTDFTQEF
jgi:hypothetical protein